MTRSWASITPTQAIEKIEEELAVRMAQTVTKAVLANFEAAATQLEKTLREDYDSLLYDLYIDVFDKHSGENSVRISMGSFGGSRHSTTWSRLSEDWKRKKRSAEIAGKATETVDYFYNGISKPGRQSFKSYIKSLKRKEDQVFGRLKIGYVFQTPRKKSDEVFGIKHSSLVEALLSPVKKQLPPKIQIQVKVYPFPKLSAVGRMEHNLAYVLGVTTGMDEQWRKVYATEFAGNVRPIRAILLPMIHKFERRIEKALIKFNKDMAG